MNVGIDGRFWTKQSSGLGKYTEELIKNLLKIDQKNQYYLFLMQKDFADFKITAPNLKKVKVQSPHYSFAEQTKLPAELSKIKLDLMHFINFNHPIQYKGKFVVTIHDLTLLFYPGNNKKNIMYRWVYKMVLKDALKRSEKIIAISKNTKKDIINKFKIQNSKIKMIYEGADFDTFKLIDRKKAKDYLLKKYKIKKPFFFYVGRWQAYKNLEFLVEAFGLFLKKYEQMQYTSHPEPTMCYSELDSGSRFRNKFGMTQNNSSSDFQLVIGGKDKVNEGILKLKIKNLKLQNYVLLPGFIADSDLPYFYAVCEAFVFPSLYEGFGLMILEAMACGAPVLSSNSSSLPEVGGTAALYFDPKNVDDLVEKMIEISKDPNLRKEMTEKGFENIKRFDWQKTAEKTLSIYNSVQNP